MTDEELLDALHVGRNVDRTVMNYLKEQRPDLLMKYMSEPNVRVPSDLQAWMEEQQKD